MNFRQHKVSFAMHTNYKQNNASAHLQVSMANHKASLHHDNDNWDPIGYTTGKSKYQTDWNQQANNRVACSHFVAIDQHYAAPRSSEAEPTYLDQSGGRGGDRSILIAIAD
jgi:hypothetical protein